MIKRKTAAIIGATTLALATLAGTPAAAHANDTAASTTTTTLARGFDPTDFLDPATFLCRHVSERFCLSWS
jgi:hypothetical protein